MKTISKLFGVVAAIAALAACNKEVADVKPVVSEGMQEITIGVAQPSTKVTMFDNTGNLEWNEGEVIAAVLKDGAGHTFVAKLEQDGNASEGGVATFSGEAPVGLNAGNITDLYYPYVEGYETAEQYASYAVSTQQNNLVPSEGKYDLKDILPLHWNGNGIYDSAVTLSADRTAMVKIDKEYAKPEEGKVKVEFCDRIYEISYAAGNDLIFLVNVPAGKVVNPSFLVNYSSPDQEYMSTNGAKDLVAGSRYQLVYGILPGVFSVSNDGGTTIKQVHFSQGNLTYNVETQTWAFYEHQYDCATGSYYDANLISLFTWGYDATNSIDPYGETYNVRISGNLEQAEDWGCTIGDGNTWRTPSKEEWIYLFGNSTERNGKYKSGVTVCGKNYCVVIAPDDWDISTNPLQENYDSSTWPAAETAGLVCLPAAGSRYTGEFFNPYGENGFYWSSTALNSYTASELSCLGYSVNPYDTGYKYHGRSVRLITESN